MKEFIKLDADGNIDDVVISEVEGIHIEALDDGHLWMAVYTPTGVINVNVTGKRLKAWLDDWRERSDAA